MPVSNAGMGNSTRSPLLPVLAVVTLALAGCLRVGSATPTDLFESTASAMLWPNEGRLGRLFASQAQLRRLFECQKPEKLERELENLEREVHDLHEHLSKRLQGSPPSRLRYVDLDADPVEVEAAGKVRSTCRLLVDLVIQPVRARFRVGNDSSETFTVAMTIIQLDGRWYLLKS